ncbi:MAG: hypothetical protein KDK99_00990 [Verrucomicrobiales bacterium]|nr:hypothetical protein [Verrucomicrobiales bacterium]
MYHYPQYGIWQSAERGYLPNPNYSEFAFAQDLTTVLVADERLPASHRIRVLPDGRLRAEPAGSPYYGAVNSAGQPMVAPRQRDDVQVAGAGSPAQPTVRRAVPQPVVRRATAEPTRYPRVFRDRRGRVYVKPWRGGEWVTSAGAYEFSAYGNPFEAAMELTSELRSEQKIPPGYRARIRGDGSIQIVGSQTM